MKKSILLNTFFQAGSSPVSSISGFSVGSGSGRVDDANDEDFKVMLCYYVFIGQDCKVLLAVSCYFR